MTRKRSSSFKSNSHQCWRACPTSGPRGRKTCGFVPGLPLVEFPPDSQPFGEVPTEEDLARFSRVKLGNLLFLLRSMVQSIWRAPNAREREFRAWTFHKLFLDKGAIRFLAAPGVFDHVAPPSPFEQSLLYLLKAADRARYCGNPNCVAPYFFAKRRSQKVLFGRLLTARPTRIETAMVARSRESPARGAP